MSGKLRENSIKWDSSTEEDDTCDLKYKMRLRDTIRNTQQSLSTENDVAVEPRKRGRGPSKRPCLNRNALMARENRQRKKAYLEKIESKLSFYQQENKNLVNIIRKQAIDLKRLNGEVSYLKSVLNNNTSINTLLKTINDSLRKISAQKKSLFHPNHISEYPKDMDAEHKTTCYTSLKENVLNAQNCNIYIANANNESLAEQEEIRNKSCETYITDSRRQYPCKDPTIDKLSFLDSDHTYTVPKTSAVDTKNSHENKETSNIITSTRSSISEDGFVDTTKDLDNILPFTQADLHSVDEKKDTDSIGLDFAQLPSFNMDIFEDIPKCDEMLMTMDGLNDTTNLFMEEDISQTLDNTGICLHVNSDKVSLEYCSICHLNSKNSGLN